MMAITNAAASNDIRGNAVDFPRMDMVMNGWMQNITLGIITTVISPETGKVLETTRWINTAGVLQPYTDEDLKILPEGDRSWIWQKLHALPSLALFTNDKIVLPDGKYRVVSKRDYTLYGYIEYSLQGDYAAS